MARDKDLDGRAEIKDEPVREGTRPEASGDGREENYDQNYDQNYDLLEERLSQKEAEAAEYLDALKRVQAEMDNFRKRMVKEQEQIIQFAALTVLRELLPVLDNLERALDAAEAKSEGGTLREGVELIYAQLKDLLAKECVEVIDPIGDEFDPQKHEAVMQVESDEYGENAVAEVLQKGYELKGRLLRPAMVKVAK